MSWSDYLATGSLLGIDNIISHSLIQEFKDEKM